MIPGTRNDYREGGEFEFERAKMGGASKVEFKTADLDKHFPTLPAKKRNTGRPPATWWQYVAEELVVYHHDLGLPERPEHVIQGLLDRLAKRGLDPLPSRSALQSLVDAVLTRIYPK